MCDQDHFEEDRKIWEAKGLVTRKQFGGALLGAGAMMMLPKTANAVTVTESEVDVKTPDGTADCYFVRPATGTAPGVVVWPDIFGLRPAFRQMGKRLAESGYSVLVINPFYRSRKGTNTPGANPPINQMAPLMQALNETTHMTDAKAFVAWLDEQPSVAKNRKIGAQGYCMGGPMALRTAAAVPARVGAAASFHGAGLVVAGDNSPHLQASRTQAQFLIAIAANDDQRAPNDKTVMRDTFAKANRPAEVEVYEGAHGWCAIDSQVYNEAQAEKAWARLLVLYGKL